MPKLYVFWNADDDLLISNERVGPCIESETYLNDNHFNILSMLSAWEEKVHAAQQ